VSGLARVEVTAAIWRKHRAGLLSSDAAGDLARAIDADWLSARFAIVHVTEAILTDAARLVARHPLRTLDAVQLSSALATRAADPDVTDFVCFDVALGTVARLEGLTVIP
jgi:predicted nucleic acid-binding protein